MNRWPFLQLASMGAAAGLLPLLALAHRQGHVSREIVALNDIMATCLDVAGIEAQHTHVASSLLAQLRGEPGDTNRAAFCESGCNTAEMQLFEPPMTEDQAAEIYYPKRTLQNEHPETITRATGFRTWGYPLVHRSDGLGELYDVKQDPRELSNVYGERSYASEESALHAQMLDWYVRIADVAPKKTDPRGFPKENNYA